MVPGDGFAIDGNRATVWAAPIDMLAIYIEGGSAAQIDLFADGHIKADFFGDSGRREVFGEFVQIAVAVGDLVKVLLKEGGAFRSGSGGPVVLFGEELVGVFFPVVLEPGGLSGGGGCGAVFVVA